VFATVTVDATWTDRLFARLQTLLPQHLLSRIVYRWTRWRWGPLKNLAIRTVVRLYGVDLSEAVETEPAAYPCFDVYFTRALRPEARPVADGPGDVVCPVDGAVSRIGVIRDGRLLQAKGLDYRLGELVTGDPGRDVHDRELREGGLRDEETTWPGCFRNGSFATLYLSPRDYHRIHMPLAGELAEMIHVPGRLFSVQPGTVRSVPRLFTRNERVTAIFRTDAGPMAVVAVGAIFVGAIETVWAGQVTPPTRRAIVRTPYPRPGGHPIRLARGEEMGRFHMGSTVIVLFGPDTVRWEPTFGPDSTVKMGQRLGRLR
jgi:phosphatidylserine decarboxylase